MAEPTPAVGTPEWALQKCLEVIRRDEPALDLYDRYMAGDHDDVYIPDGTDPEFQMLADRAPLNLMGLIVNSVTQVCYVDSIRHASDIELDRDGEGEKIATIPPEVDSWQHNRMDARQIPIVRTLAGHGIVYVLTVKGKDGRARYEGYPGQRAVAIFDDPINDLDPSWALVIKKGEVSNLRLGWLFNETHQWDVTHGKHGYSFSNRRPHGNTSVPVTRAGLHLDLWGGFDGLVSMCKTEQDQVNQTSFDILSAQSYTSFQVRYATGMSIPIKRWSKAEIDATWPQPDPSSPEYTAWLATDKPSVGDPVLDPNGQEIPLPIRVNQKRFLVAEDADSKFGSPPETDISPLLKALSECIKNLAAKAQMPPTYLMGEMANLSAEALNAAEISKTRRDGEIRMVLAEMWERVLRLGMELEGHQERADDVNTEMVWADMDPRSLAAVADAYGKFAELLGVPVTALWEDIPGMTTGKLKRWLEIRDKEREDNPELAMARTIDQMDTLSLADPNGVPVSG